MSKLNLVIPVNPDIGSQAQAVLHDKGFDIVTVVDNFLRQIVHNKEKIPFELVSVNFTNLSPTTKPNQLVETRDSFIDISQAKGRPAKLGGWEDKAWISDDFNAPLEDFEEYE